MRRFRQILLILLFGGFFLSGYALIRYASTMKDAVSSSFFLAYAVLSTLSIIPLYLAARKNEPLFLPTFILTLLLLAALTVLWINPSMISFAWNVVLGLFIIHMGIGVKTLIPLRKWGTIVLSIFIVVALILIMKTETPFVYEIGFGLLAFSTVLGVIGLFMSTHRKR